MLSVSRTGNPARVRRVARPGPCRWRARAGRRTRPGGSWRRESRRPGPRRPRSGPWSAPGRDSAALVPASPGRRPAIRPAGSSSAAAEKRCRRTSSVHRPCRSSGAISVCRYSTTVGRMRPPPSRLSRTRNAPVASRISWTSAIPIRGFPCSPSWRSGEPAASEARPRSTQRDQSRTA